MDACCVRTGVVGVDSHEGDALHEHVPLGVPLDVVVLLLLMNQCV